LFGSLSTSNFNSNTINRNNSPFEENALVSEAGFLPSLMIKK
jgi:hypothetical protein